MFPQQTKVGQSHDSRRKQEYLEMCNYCEMYAPCPINYKCMNKATHLYKRCEECPVPHATHTHKSRAWAIRRENFAIDVSEETGKLFLELSRKAEEHEATHL